MEAAIFESIGASRPGVGVEKGYIDGNDLLKDLSGENGTGMRSVAVGYVMAIHDSMRSGARAVREGIERHANATLGQEAADVESWLRRNPDMRERVAADLVRTALSDTVEAETPRFGAREVRGRVGIWPGVRTASLVAMACFVASGLTWGLNSAYPHKNRDVEQALEQSLRASDITNLVLEERRYEKDTFLNIADRDQEGSYVRRWDDARIALDTAIARLDRLDLSESDRHALRDIENDFRAYVDGYKTVVERIRKGQIRTAQEANDEIAKYKDAIHRMEFNAATISIHANQRMSTIA
jgi:hypothetical protein